MQLKTSTALSLKFTLYVIGLFLLLGLFVNGGNIMRQYHNADQVLYIGEGNKNPELSRGEFQKGERPRKMPMMQPRKDILSVLPMTPSLLETLEEGRIYKNISRIDEDIYVVYGLGSGGNEIRINDITREVHMFEDHLQMRLFGLIIFGLITYGVSLLFVRSSLAGLWKLTNFVQHLDIYTLDKRLQLIGPSDDEIRTISAALNGTLDTIYTQINSLKDFVSYASHELKTPLMVMSSHLDLVEKTQDFGNFIKKQKSHISRMQGLFEQLLQLTRAESGTLVLTPIDLVPIVQDIYLQIQQQFPTRQIDIYTIDSLIKKSELSLFSSILTNLIMNAIHHSPHDASIAVILHTEELRVSNTGSYISPEDQKKVFEKFWKKGGQGTGLGLVLVKQLVEQHHRHISVESSEEYETAFIVSF